MSAAVGLVHRQLHCFSDKDAASGILLSELLRRKPAQGIFYHPALKLFLELVALLGLGQQVAGLYIYEPCRHFKEIRSLLVILRFYLRHIIEVLLEEQGYLDVVDIQLMLGHQVQQKIQRSLKGLKPERNGCHVS